MKWMKQDNQRSFNLNYLTVCKELGFQDIVTYITHTTFMLSKYHLDSCCYKKKKKKKKRKKRPPLSETMIRVMIIAPKKVREKGRTQRMQSALCISTMKSWKHMRRQLLLLAGQNTLTQRYRWPAGSLPLSSIRVKNMDQCVCVCVILCLMHEVHLGTVLGVPTFLGLL